jgi:hypothetical protein
MQARPELLPVSQLRANPENPRVHNQFDAVEHATAADVANRLDVLGHRLGDKEAIDFAHAVAADSLSDLELQIPMTIVIGDYLRARLAPAKP